MEHPHFPLTPCDFNQWLKLESWPHDQAAYILLGYEPPPLEYLRFHYDPSMLGPRPPTWDEPDGVDGLIQALFDAIEIGIIPSHQRRDGIYETRRVTPKSLVEWAKRKGREIPLELQPYAQEPESKPDIETDIENRSETGTTPFPRGWYLSRLGR